MELVVDTEFWTQGLSHRMFRNIWILRNVEKEEGKHDKGQAEEEVEDGESEEKEEKKIEG
jgi:hypothetical protein